MIKSRFCIAAIFEHTAQLKRYYIAVLYSVAVLNCGRYCQIAAFLIHLMQAAGDIAKKCVQFEQRISLIFHRKIFLRKP